MLTSDDISVANFSIDLFIILLEVLSSDDKSVANVSMILCDPSRLKTPPSRNNYCRKINNSKFSKRAIVKKIISKS